jgi:hypothetical protein
MSVSARISGSWKAGDLYGRVAGAWKLLAPSVRTGSAWKSVAGGAAALSVTLDKSSLFKSRTPASTSPITSNDVTATPAGGTAPYTYAWTQDSGDALAIGHAAAATTNFSANPPEPVPSEFSAVMRCTVTDNVGATAYALVYVDLQQDNAS